MDYFIYLVSMFFGLLSFQIARVYSGSIEAKVVVSQGIGRGPHLLLSSLGQLGCTASFVLAFFLFSWWLVILGWLIASIAMAMPALYLKRDVDRAMAAHPWLQIISLGGAVVLLLMVLGFLEIEPSWQDMVDSML